MSAPSCAANGNGTIHHTVDDNNNSACDVNQLRHTSKQSSNGSDKDKVLDAVALAVVHAREAGTPTERPSAARRSSSSAASPLRVDSKGALSQVIPNVPPTPPPLPAAAATAAAAAAAEQRNTGDARASSPTLRRNLYIELGSLRRTGQRADLTKKSNSPPGQSDQVNKKPSAAVSVVQPQQRVPPPLQVCEVDAAQRTQIGSSNARTPVSPGSSPSSSATKKKGSPAPTRRTRRAHPPRVFNRGTRTEVISVHDTNSEGGSSNRSSSSRSVEIAMQPVHTPPAFSVSPPHPSGRGQQRRFATAVATPATNNAGGSVAPTTVTLQSAADRASRNFAGSRAVASSSDSQPPPLTDMTHAPDSQLGSSWENSLAETANSSVASAVGRQGDTAASAKAPSARLLRITKRGKRRLGRVPDRVGSGASGGSSRSVRTAVFNEADPTARHGSHAAKKRTQQLPHAQGVGGGGRRAAPAVFFSHASQAQRESVSGESSETEAERRGSPRFASSSPARPPSTDRGVVGGRTGVVARAPVKKNTKDDERSLLVTPSNCLEVGCPAEGGHSPHRLLQPPPTTRAPLSLSASCPSKEALLSLDGAATASLSAAAAVVRNDAVDNAPASADPFNSSGLPAGVQRASREGPVQSPPLHAEQNTGSSGASSRAAPASTAHVGVVKVDGSVSTHDVLSRLGESPSLPHGAPPHAPPLPATASTTNANGSSFDIISPHSPLFVDQEISVPLLTAVLALPTMPFGRSGPPPASPLRATMTSGSASEYRRLPAAFTAAPQLVPEASQEFFVRGQQRMGGGGGGALGRGQPPINAHGLVLQSPLVVRPAGLVGATERWRSSPAQRTVSRPDSGMDGETSASSYQFDIRSTYSVPHALMTLVLDPRRPPVPEAAAHPRIKEDAAGNTRSSGGPGGSGSETESLRTQASLKDERVPLSPTHSVDEEGNLIIYKPPAEGERGVEEEEKRDAVDSKHEMPPVLTTTDTTTIDSGPQRSPPPRPSSDRHPPVTAVPCDTRAFAGPPPHTLPSQTPLSADLAPLFTQLPSSADVIASNSSVPVQTSSLSSRPTRLRTQSTSSASPPAARASVLLAGDRYRYSSLSGSPVPSLPRLAPPLPAPAPIATTRAGATSAATVVYMTALHDSQLSSSSPSAVPTSPAVSGHSAALQSVMESSEWSASMPPPPPPPPLHCFDTQLQVLSQVSPSPTNATSTRQQPQREQEGRDAPTASVKLERAGEATEGAQQQPQQTQQPQPPSAAQTDALAAGPAATVPPLRTGKSVLRTAPRARPAKTPQHVVTPQRQPASSTQGEAQVERATLATPLLSQPAVHTAEEDEERAAAAEQHPQQRQLTRLRRSPSGTGVAPAVEDADVPRSDAVHSVTASHTAEPAPSATVSHASPLKTSEPPVALPRVPRSVRHPATTAVPTPAVAPAAAEVTLPDGTAAAEEDVARMPADALKQPTSKNANHADVSPPSQAAAAAAQPRGEEKAVVSQEASAAAARGSRPRALHNMPAGERASRLTRTAAALPVSATTTTTANTIASPSVLSTPSAGRRPSVELQAPSSPAATTTTTAGPAVVRGVTALTARDAAPALSTTTITTAAGEAPRSSSPSPSPCQNDATQRRLTSSRVQELPSPTRSPPPAALAGTAANVAAASAMTAEVPRALPTYHTSRSTLTPSAAAVRYNTTAAAPPPQNAFAGFASSPPVPAEWTGGAVAASPYARRATYNRPEPLTGAARQPSSQAGSVATPVPATRCAVSPGAPKTPRASSRGSLARDAHLVNTPGTDFAPSIIAAPSGAADSRGSSPEASALLQALGNWTPVRPAHEQQPNAVHTNELSEKTAPIARSAAVVQAVPRSKRQMRSKRSSGAAAARRLPAAAAVTTTTTTVAASPYAAHPRRGSSSVAPSVRGEIIEVALAGSASVVAAAAVAPSACASQQHAPTSPAPVGQPSAACRAPPPQEAFTAVSAATTTMGQSRATHEAEGRFRGFQTVPLPLPRTSPVQNTERLSASAASAQPAAPAHVSDRVAEQQVSSSSPPPQRTTQRPAPAPSPPVTLKRPTATDARGLYFLATPPTVRVDGPVHPVEALHSSEWTVVREVLPRSGLSQRSSPASLSQPLSTGGASLASGLLQAHQRQAGCRSHLPRTLPSLSLTPDPVAASLLSIPAESLQPVRSHSVEAPESVDDSRRGSHNRHSALGRLGAMGQRLIPLWMRRGRRRSGGGAEPAPQQQQRSSPTPPRVARPPDFLYAVAPTPHVNEGTDNSDMRGSHVHHQQQQQQQQSLFPREVCTPLLRLPTVLATPPAPQFASPAPTENGATREPLHAATAGQPLRGLSSGSRSAGSLPGEAGNYYGAYQRSLRPSGQAPGAAMPRRARTASSELPSSTPSQPRGAPADDMLREASFLPLLAQQEASGLQGVEVGSGSPGSASQLPVRGARNIPFHGLRLRPHGPVVPASAQRGPHEEWAEGVYAEGDCSDRHTTPRLTRAALDGFQRAQVAAKAPAAPPPSVPPHTQQQQQQQQHHALSDTPQPYLANPRYAEQQAAARAVRQPGGGLGTPIVEEVEPELTVQHRPVLSAPSRGQGRAGQPLDCLRREPHGPARRATAPALFVATAARSPSPVAAQPSPSSNRVWGRRAAQPSDSPAPVAPTHATRAQNRPLMPTYYTAAAPTSTQGSGAATVTTAGMVLPNLNRPALRTDEVPTAWRNAGAEPVTPPLLPRVRPDTRTATATAAAAAAAAGAGAAAAPPKSSSVPLLRGREEGETGGGPQRRASSMLRGLRGHKEERHGRRAGLRR